MSGETLIIGDVKFAAKTGKLLGYTLNNGLYSPKEIDFTRNSTATYLNNSNVLSTSAANIVRVQGSNLLIEPDRTNTMYYSEDLANATYWYCTATITSNNTTAPTGATTADKITFTALDQSSAQSTTVLANNTTYWFSCFVKNSTFVAGETFLIRVNRYAGVNAVLTIDLAAGTVTPSFDASPGNVYVSNSLKSSIENYGNGWYRIGLGFTTGSAGAASGVGTQLLYGNAAKALFAWGFQFEEGSFLTSYIPTTTTPVFRPRDLVKISNASSLLTQPFTIYGALNLIDKTVEQYFLDVLGLQNGNESRSFICVKRYGNNRVDFALYNSGTYDIITSPFGNANGNLKVAFTYDGAITKFYVNGTLCGTSTYTPYQNRDRIYLSSSFNDVGNYSLFSTLKIFNSVLSEADCINLTANFSTEALAWKSRVEANGGVVPTYILGLFDNFFFKPAVAAGNILNKLDRLNIYSGLSTYQIAARTNLINNNFYVTPVNNPIFDINGYKSNGVDSYLDLNFTGSTNFVQNSNIGGVVMFNPDSYVLSDMMGVEGGSTNYTLTLASGSLLVSNNGVLYVGQTGIIENANDYVFMATRRNNPSTFEILVNSSHNFLINPNNLTLPPWAWAPTTGSSGYTITHSNTGGINNGPYDTISSDNPLSSFYYQYFTPNPVGANGTFSVYLKGTGDVRLGIYNSQNPIPSALTYITLTNTWTKYSVNKGDLLSTYSEISIYFDSMNTTVDIANCSFEATPDPVVVTDTSQPLPGLPQYELSINSSSNGYFDTQYHACSFHGSADLNYTVFRELIVNLLNALPDEAYRP